MDKYIEEFDRAVDWCLANGDAEGLEELYRRATKELTDEDMRVIEEMAK